MRILIADNTMDTPWELCADIRRHLNGHGPVVVRRSPQEDLPRDPGLYSHIILSGSRASCTQSAPWIDRLMTFIHRAVDAGVPLLGICYGHQAIARALGGQVGKCARPEFGWVELVQHATNPILANLPERFYSFESHFEEVQKLPDGLIAVAKSEHCGIQAYHMRNKPVFGIQFHPEKNGHEGQASIDAKKKTVPEDCIFNDGKAKSLFDENVAKTIFSNFLGYRNQ